MAAVTDLTRAEAVRCHGLYKQEYEALTALEQNRIYCRHTMEHFLDVARVCWIRVLEQGLEASKDLVYAAALLHDLGRARQYRDGTAHELAGAELAEAILPECGFTPEETQRIASLIRAHRSRSCGDPLAAVLYDADKKTRLCFACPASGSCNWPEEKKNHTLSL